MTAAEIGTALIRDRWRRNFCLPTYTPIGWWECDIFEVTAAGVFREYEIKLSRADFFADRRKEQPGKYLGRDPETRQPLRGPAGVKHDLLARGYPRGPQRFWFVAPEGILAVADMPLWAGLIVLVIGWE